MGGTLSRINRWVEPSVGPVGEDDTRPIDPNNRVSWDSWQSNRMIGPLQSSLGMCTLICLVLILLFVFIMFIMTSVVVHDVGEVLAKTNAPILVSINNITSPSPVVAPNPPINLVPPTTTTSSPITPPPPPAPAPSPPPLPAPPMSPPMIPFGSFDYIMASSPDYNTLVLMNNSYGVDQEFSISKPHFMIEDPIWPTVVYVSASRLNQGYIYVYNGSSFITSVRLPLGYIAFDLIVDPNGLYLFVTTGQNSVSAFTNKLFVFNMDRSSFTFAQLPPMVFGSFLQRMDMTPDGSLLYVTDGDTSLLHVISVPTLSYLTNFSVGFGMGLVYLPPLTNNIAFVSGGLNTVGVFINTVSGNKISTINLPVGQLGNVVCVDYVPSTKLIYIPNGLNSLFVYDISSITQPKLVSNYTTGNTPSCVVVSEPDNTIYVANALDNSVSVFGSTFSFNVTFGSKTTNSVGPLSLLLVE